MAVKDKLVTVEHVKVLSDEINEDIGEVKSDIQGVKNSVGTMAEFKEYLGLEDNNDSGNSGNTGD